MGEKHENENTLKEGSLNKNESSNALRVTENYLISLTGRTDNFLLMLK